MKEAVNLCDMLCYRSSALFNVSEMFLTRHATEHAVRVGVTVAGAFAFGCAGTFAGHAATEAPCASANTPECSWRGTARVLLVHRQAAAAGAGGAGGYAPTVGHCLPAASEGGISHKGIRPHPQRQAQSQPSCAARADVVARSLRCAPSSYCLSHTSFANSLPLWGFLLLHEDCRHPLLQVWPWSRR